MSKFNQKINEMLVVLNAVKKPKKDEEEKEYKIDPVSSAMNDALGRFGMSVSNDTPEAEPEETEDPIEGSIEDMEDLDLPRPADDSGEEEKGKDEDSKEDDSKDFDFMNVGNPSDMEPTDTDNFKDEGDVEDDVSGEGKVRFEFSPGKGVVLAIGDSEVTLSKEQVETVKQFLSTLPDDFEADDNQEGNSFDSESDSDDGDKEDEEKDESDDDGFNEARFDDPNPSSKKCKCGGTMTYDKHNQQYKCPKCHAWERGKSSL